jgi:putative methyltransferase (TIGR04325 family)
LSLAQHIKPFLPPAALPVARSVAALIRRPEWSYLPEGWREDDPRGMGWHHPSVTEAQRRRWPDFVAAVESTGPLGIGHEAVQIESDDILNQNILLAFAHVLGRAAAGRDRLSVLDWGGGLGYYAVVARSVLPEIAFDYTVEDLPGVCQAARELLPEVRFTSGEAEALSHRYDLVFASSSLQYSRDWRVLLRRLAAAADRWVFITRLPLFEGDAPRAVVQRPHWAGYQTEYISWVFSRPDFLDAAASCGLALEREFLVRDAQASIKGIPRSYERGFLFRTAGRDA